MTVAARRSSIVARSSAARRFAVVERLRRALFSPSKLLAVGALALALSAQSAFAQETVTGAMEAKNYVVNGTLDLTGAFYGDVTQNYGDYSINLNGGTLKLSSETWRPIYDAETETLYSFGFWAPGYQPEAKENHQEIIADIQRSMENGFNREKLYGGRINKDVEIKGHYLNLSQGGTLELTRKFVTITSATGYVYSDPNSIITFYGSLPLQIAPQQVNQTLTLNGRGKVAFIEGDIKDFRSRYHPTGISIFKEDVNLEGRVELEIYGDSTFYGHVNLRGSGEEARILTNDTYNGKAVYILESCEKEKYYEDGVAQTALTVASGNHKFYNGITARDSWVYLGSGTAGAGNTIVGNPDGKTNTNVNIGLSSNCYILYSEVEFCNTNIDICNYEIGSDGNYNVNNTLFEITNIGSAPVLFNENCLLTIDGIQAKNFYNAEVRAPARWLNVDIEMKNEGALVLQNRYADGSSTGKEDFFFVTLDENRKPTPLKCSAGYINIQDANEHLDIVTRNIKSESANTAIQICSQGKASTDTLNTSNGYTVIFNNDNASQKSFDYGGKTVVDTGFMVIADDTNYGSYNTSNGRSVFSVFGESYVRNESNPNLWKVWGCGMLGFARNNSATAPSITADVVVFQNGISHNYVPAIGETLLGGARIWIDAANGGELGAINTKTLIFGDQTQIYFAGISSLPSDQKSTFTLNAQQIKYDDTATLLVPGVTLKNEKIFNYNVLLTGEAFDDAVAGLADATEQDIQNLFASPLIDAKYEQNYAADGKVTGGTVTVTAKSVG